MTLIDSLRKADTLCVVAGYRGAFDFLKRFAFPILVVAFVLSFLLLFVQVIPSYFSILVFVFGCFIAFSYPYGVYLKRKRDVENHLHFFITYAGTISTMKISRLTLFKRISEKTSFGFISDIFEKALYLAKGWTLGYASACRQMARRTPSKAFSDFLDRFAVMMDFGEELEVFLIDEQSAVLDDYSVEYKKSLENIRLLQELFVAISVSISFVLGIALLAPLLMDISITFILELALLGMFTMDVLLVALITAFIPKDVLFSEHKFKNNFQKRIDYVFLICASVSLVGFGVLFFGFGLRFMISLAIAILPLLIPGFMAAKEEDNIVQRDKQFPVYVRVLGSAIEVRNGGVVSALRSTQVHEFGVLNNPSINLYRRLRLGCDKIKSWEYFATECGSNIIHQFGRIFYQSVYLGGNALKIGEIISKNIARLLELRKLRLQLAKGLRGAFYGSLVGLTSTMYVTASVAQVLVNLFARPEGLDESVFSFVSAIIPQAGGVDFSQVLMIIGFLIVMHSAASAYIMKIIDGGSIYAGLVDFIAMVWIGALLSWILPTLVGEFLPDFSGVWSGTGT